MKKLNVLFFFLVFTLFVFGQKPLKAVISVPSMGCEECEKIITDALYKKVDGLQAIDVKWKRKTVKVTYITDRIDLGNLKLMIAQLGFDADEEKADEAIMARLPKCCQRVVVKPVVVVAPPEPSKPIPLPIKPPVTNSKVVGKPKDTIATKGSKPVPKTTIKKKG
jgi:periplasmic mercuric ion binding protein